MNFSASFDRYDDAIKFIESQRFLRYRDRDDGEGFLFCDCPDDDSVEYVMVSVYPTRVSNFVDVWDIYKDADIDSPCWYIEQVD